MRHSRTEKAATHSKIVAVAAKRFRELGLEGIGVADVMKEAGSSVGGFYKHFESRDELVIEALAEAFKDLERWEQEAEDLPALLRFYLGEEHCDRPGTGCAITALAGDSSSCEHRCKDGLHTACETQPWLLCRSAEGWRRSIAEGAKSTLA